MIHFIVLVIAHPKTGHGDEDAFIPVRFDHSFHFGIARGPYIEVAIGGQNDTVIAVLHEVFRCYLVGQL